MGAVAQSNMLAEMQRPVKTLNTLVDSHVASELEVLARMRGIAGGDEDTDAAFTAQATSLCELAVRAEACRQGIEQVCHCNVQNAAQYARLCLMTCVGNVSACCQWWLVPLAKAREHLVKCKTLFV